MVIKFPSTPVLILLKFCNTTTIFCDLGQDSNLHSPDSIANTAGHVLILYPTFGSFASLLFLIVG